MYGTSVQSVRHVLRTRHCVLDIDLQGVISLKQCKALEGVHASKEVVEHPKPSHA